MAKLTDSDPMPQGKYKGQTMENVPYWHLLWLYDQPFCRRDVRALRRCVPELVELGIIELVQKEYPAEQLTIKTEPGRVPRRLNNK